MNPETGGRFPRELRWPTVLAQELGADYEVIAEGLNARTTVHTDPIKGGDKSGIAYLGPCLESHHPLSLVVIMLGTNDLKRRFRQLATEIAMAAARLVQTVQRCDYGPGGRAPAVLLVSPPPLGTLTNLAAVFEGAEETSRALAEAYREQAELLGCAFLDAGRFVQSSDLDGIHLEADAHRALGEAVARHVRDLPLQDTS
jgi:lysophospholipase L1-like esterase